LEAEPGIQVWPDWLGRLPFLAFRTTVDVKPEG
jgi:hypothetical protein